MLEAFLQRQVNAPLIYVEIIEAEGSTPRGIGAYMLVSLSEISGTIGGGALEFIAIDHARKILLGDEINLEITCALGPSINQCCGGRVNLRFAEFDQTAREKLLAEDIQRRGLFPRIIIFGAGHVGQALAKTLSFLPVQTILTDTRSDCLVDLSFESKSIEIVAHALPEKLVRDAQPCTAYIVLTHDHDLDFNIISETLKRGDASYVGLIGSKTKRASFQTRFLHDGGTEAAFANLICPIGKNETGDKRPEVIAAFVAAELCAALLAPMPTSE